MEAVRLLTDRYRLVERLGAGGMSVVWRAHDEVLGRDVAVKMLSGRYAGDAASRDLIRYEAQAAGRLSHPHVTSVYDYGEAVEPDGTRVPYVVMELVEGATLDARLAEGPVPWPVAVRIAAEVAAALAAAHARGLVHRDIKPANVMLTPAGVKVVDFGIAALAGANPENSTVILGTPAYVAPERLDGKAVTPASDVYALGLLLFRMLTGRLPWQAETVTQMIVAHQYTEPQPLPPVAGLPLGVADVCARSLAKLPEDRPSAEEVARDLATAAGTRVPLPHDDALNWDPIDRADAETERIAVGAPAAGRRRRRPGRRGAALMAGAAAAVTATSVLAWSAFDSKPAADAATVAAGPTRPAAAPPPPCEVRYQTEKDQAGTFTVDVDVVNRSNRPASDWTLRFDFPADQRLTGGTGAAWSQSGKTVTAHGTGAIAPGGSAAMRMTGGYQDSNPIPTQFTLDDAVCRAVITGAVNVPVKLPATTPATGSTAGSSGDGAPASGSGTDAKGDAGQLDPAKLRDLLRQLQTGHGDKKKYPKGDGNND